MSGSDYVSDDETNGSDYVSSDSTSSTKDKEPDTIPGECNTIDKKTRKLCGGVAINKNAIYCSKHLPISLEQQEFYDEFIEWLETDLAIDHTQFNKYLMKSLYRTFMNLARRMSFILDSPETELRRITFNTNAKEKIVYIKTKGYWKQVIINSYRPDLKPSEILVEARLHKYVNTR